MPFSTLNSLQLGKCTPRRLIWRTQSYIRYSYKHPYFRRPFKANISITTSCTDCSKFVVGVGAAVVSQEQSNKITLPAVVSIFIAELHALRLAVGLIRWTCEKKLYALTRWALSWQAESRRKINWLRVQRGTSMKWHNATVEEDWDRVLCWSFTMVRGVLIWMIAQAACEVVGVSRLCAVTSACDWHHVGPGFNSLLTTYVGAGTIFCISGEKYWCPL